MRRPGGRRALLRQPVVHPRAAARRADLRGPEQKRDGSYDPYSFYAVMLDIVYNQAMRENLDETKKNVTPDLYLIFFKNEKVCTGKKVKLVNSFIFLNSEIFLIFNVFKEESYLKYLLI